jgi:hypothetical protein
MFGFLKSAFFLFCPRTGRIVGINYKSMTVRLLFPITGLIALVWFFIRVIPKPSRAGYPCMQVAVPYASSFVAYVLGLAGATMAFGKARLHMRKCQAGLAAVSILSGLSIAVFLFTPFPGHDIRAEDTKTFTPSEGSNNPVGTARGIMPGRVAWAYDVSACNWDGTSKYWFSSNFNDQAKIDTLMKNTVCSVANKSTVAAAWDTLFKYKNGGAAYVKGEKIAIKINLNNGGNYDNDIDASPQSVCALLDQLVNQFGANQSDITVCDPARENGCTVVYDYCHTAFPNVIYDSNLGGWTGNVITYSASGPAERTISNTIYNTKYLITLAILKRHAAPSATWGTDGVDDGNAPVTLIFKSCWGIIGNNRSSMHALLHDWDYPLNSYHLLVDIFGSKYINGKTVLNILDGLYSGNLWNSGPHKWAMAPFNGHWPSSFFASQDPVALESVGIDFLESEMGLTGNADRCVREAAQANNPPSGTVYAPDGVRLPSLGVYEHWNNSTDKKYSRNLGTGNGIELVNVSTVVPPALPASIFVSPASVDVQTGTTFQFAAIAKDNSGTALASQPTFTWTTSGGGTVNAGGLFTVSSAAGGTFTVTASVGTIKGTATVSVVTTAPVLGTNVALDKPAAALSQQTGNGAANGNDGGLTTRWCASSGVFPQWWRVDLGNPLTLTGTKIVWEKGGIVYYYKIDVSSDSVTWTTKMDKTMNVSTSQTQIDSFSANAARYVRLTVNGTSSGDWASLYEFSVYSAASVSLLNRAVPGIHPGAPGATEYFDISGRRIVADDIRNHGAPGGRPLGTAMYIKRTQGKSVLAAQE